MTLATLIIAWLAFPVGLWLILKRKTSYALPLVAVVIAFGLFAIAKWMQTDGTAVSLSSAQNGVAQGTTYVFSKGKYLQNLCPNYLMVAALAALTVKFGQNLTVRMIPLGFWMNHVGCMALALLPFIAANNMPRRYIDYPVWYAWINRISFTGTILSYLGIICLILVTFYALIQTLNQRKT